MFRPVFECKIDTIRASIVPSEASPVILWDPIVRLSSSEVITTDDHFLETSGSELYFRSVNIMTSS